MTTFTPGTYAGTDTDTGRSRTVRRSTETKAGPKTTEFVFMVLFIVAVLVATYIDDNDSLAKENGWLYAAIVAAAYMISRGLAKLGVRDPYTEEIGAR